MTRVFWTLKPTFFISIIKFLSISLFSKWDSILRILWNWIKVLLFPGQLLEELYLLINCPYWMSFLLNKLRNCVYRYHSIEQTFLSFLFRFRFDKQMFGKLEFLRFLHFCIDLKIVSTFLIFFYSAVLLGCLIITNIQTLLQQLQCLNCLIQLLVYTEFSYGIATISRWKLPSI